MANLTCNKCGSQFPTGALVTVPYKTMEDLVHQKSSAEDKADRYHKLLVASGIDPKLADPKPPTVVSTGPPPPIEPPPGGWVTMEQVAAERQAREAAEPKPAPPPKKSLFGV